MDWRLVEEYETPDGAVRWAVMGSGDPVVLVHGTPYSSFLWRHMPGTSAGSWSAGACHAPASSPTTSAERSPWRTLLLERASFRDLTLFDAVSGGDWERGLFQLILKQAEVFQQLPSYAHEALVAGHLRHATHAGFRPGILEAFLAPWRGAEGQAAFYRQYRQVKQVDTAAYEHLLGEVSLPVRLIWGREDRILPPQYARWLHEKIPHAELHWIEEAGHLLQGDAPARLMAHLTARFAPPV